MNKRNEHGITIVVLIIIVILMLILTAVTIDSLADMGIFQQTLRVVDSTQEQIENQQNMVEEVRN